MTDTKSGEHLRVLRVRTGGAMIRVPEAQLDALQALLSESGVVHWPHDTAVAEDGQTFFTYVDLGPKEDPSRVQAILDAH